MPGGRCEGGGIIPTVAIPTPEALILHIEGMLEDGETIPEPSSFDSIMAERESRGAVAFLVCVPGLARTVRVDITMTDRDLAEIDGAAEARGMTRSAFLVASAKRALSSAA